MPGAAAQAGGRGLPVEPARSTGQGGGGPLGPVRATLHALSAHGGADATRGLAEPLVVARPAGWIPAAELVSGPALATLLGAADRRWGAAPHTNAALAWKSYSYWLAMPAAVGWAVARRVPLVGAENVLVQVDAGGSLVRLGLRAERVAVLASDPLARAGDPGVEVVAGERELLAALRLHLLDRHLGILADRIRATVRIGRRGLLGSVAAAVGHALIRADRVLPGAVRASAGTLLDALDMADLVRIIPPDGAGYPALVRHTCCLAFTLPEPRVCSCCCLHVAGRPNRRR